VWGGNLEQVKSRAPNALGLYDMSGNVFEWVNDHWFYATGNVQNCAIQVLERGGCYLFDPKYLAVGMTYYFEADGKTMDGIRLVCSVVR
jgi:formylglycine-generating enzyme required for sulfatase activity